MINPIKKIIYGLRYSFYGLQYLLKDHSWLIELATMVTITLVLMYVDKSNIEKLFLFSSCALVLIAEAFNAAIEAVVDKASPEIHTLAKKSKDIASSAVFLTIINALIVWGVMFLF